MNDKTQVGSRDGWQCSTCHLLSLSWVSHVQNVGIGLSAHFKLLTCKRFMWGQLNLILQTCENCPHHTLRNLAFNALCWLF